MTKDIQPDLTSNDEVELSSKIVRLFQLNLS